MQLPESATGTVATTKTVTTTERTTAYRNTISKSDPYLIDRIVGYHEYGKALHYLDRLVAKCNQYEIEAVDEIVKAEPEFAIYTVSDAPLHSQHAPGQRRTNLPTELKKSDAADNGRKRHGLNWITALARVEIGAMEASFSQHVRPFSKARSPGYDAAEYRTLLAESARVHFWTLSRDPMFRSLRRRFQPSSWTLAYLRRMNIATAFALAAGQSTSRAEPAQVAEMASYAQRLNAARAAIQLRIAAHLAYVELSRNVQTKNSAALALLQLCDEGVCRSFADNTNIE